MPARNVAQLALDERQVDDPELEQALEARLEGRADYDAARAAYNELDTVAKAAVEKLELPEGAAVRVGRFRITRQSVAGRRVEFETSATSRVKIDVIGDEG